MLLLTLGGVLSFFVLSTFYSCHVDICGSIKQSCHYFFVLFRQVFFLFSAVLFNDSVCCFFNLCLIIVLILSKKKKTQKIHKMLQVIIDIPQLHEQHWLSNIINSFCFWQQFCRTRNYGFYFGYLDTESIFQIKKKKIHL